MDAALVLYYLILKLNRCWYLPVKFLHQLRFFLQMFVVQLKLWVGQQFSRINFEFVLFLELLVFQEENVSRVRFIHPGPNLTHLVQKLLYLSRYYLFFQRKCLDTHSFCFFFLIFFFRKITVGKRFEEMLRIIIYWTELFLVVFVIFFFHRLSFGSLSYYLLLDSLFNSHFYFLFASLGYISLDSSSFEKSVLVDIKHKIFKASGFHNLKFEV